MPVRGTVYVLVKNPFDAGCKSHRGPILGTKAAQID